MAVHGLYRKAKQEVDEEYKMLRDMGFRPVANKDGKTYSWINDEGKAYTGGLNPTGGRYANEGKLKQVFQREGRQDRLMSEKVSAELDKSVNLDDYDTTIQKAQENKGNTTTTTDTTPAATDKNKELYDKWLKERYDFLQSGAGKKQEEEVTNDQPVGGLDRNPLIARPTPKEPQIGWYPGRNILTTPNPVTKPATESAYGREVPRWGDPEAPHSRVVYVPMDEWNDPNSEFRRANDKAVMPGVRKGPAGEYFGAMPISQNRVNWMNTLSDWTPMLPGSGMHAPGDKTYAPRIKDEKTGKEYILVFNPTAQRALFNTKSGADAYAEAGWGRKRPIVQTPTGEYQVGTNFWDQVKVFAGSADATVNNMLAGLGGTKTAPTPAQVKGSVVAAPGKIKEGVKQAYNYVKSGGLKQTAKDVFGKAKTLVKKPAAGKAAGKRTNLIQNELVVTPKGKPTQILGPKITPKPRGGAKVTAGSAPQNVSTLQGEQAHQQLLPFRDDAGKFFPVRKKSGGQLKPKN